jgi:adenine-specific DNA glycosylase
VPKNRGAEFLDLMEDLTNDTCVEGEPDCTRCELRKICTFAMTRKTAVKATSRTGPSRGVKEPAKTAKGKPADQASARPTEKKPSPKSAKQTPRSDKPRGEKRRGTK